MKNVAWLAVAVILATATTSYAGKVIKGDIDGGTYGELIRAGFVNEVKMDGDLDELVWNHAPWHVMGAKDGTVAAKNDADASVEFAAVADEQYLYIAARVRDDKVQSGEDMGCDVWKDDSVELYIDAGNEKANSYDINDAQITVGAIFIGEKPDPKAAADLLGGCVGATQGPTTGTFAAAQLTKVGWDVEIAIPLENAGWKIKLKDGLKIGFNLHYNDDDDGADRDHKLIWSAQEVALGEDSWRNPSRFAELEFVKATLSVDAAGKLATTWSALKR